jgi:hypothetical protein
VKAKGAGEYELEIPPPLALDELTPALAHTLQHIVGKLDMMTQVIGMVEERLSLNEDKMAGIESELVELKAALQLKATPHNSAHEVSGYQATHVQSERV